MHVIRELANGRSVDYHGSTITFPWAAKSELEVWVAGYGPRALALAGEVGDGFILQLADPQIVDWTIAAVREGAGRVGRDPDAITICVAAPAYVGDDVAHQRDQCRWFGGMVGNHVADIVGRYGDSSDVPAALTEYIKGRQGYDYNQHGQAGNTHADFVPDEIVDRFCILGPVAEHVAPPRGAAPTSASTSSPSTSSTTARTPRCRRTASTSSRRSPRPGSPSSEQRWRRDSARWGCSPCRWCSSPRRGSCTS